MKNKRIKITIVSLLLLALYLGAAVIVLPYGPDIIIHNTGETNVSCIIRISGVSQQHDIAKKNSIHLKDLVSSEGSIELEVEKEKTVLYGYCGNYNDGVIEVEINKDVKITHSEVTSGIFNWDLK